MTEWYLFLGTVAVGVIGWGLKQVYNVLTQIKTELVKMNVNIVTHELIQTEHSETLKDHESRLRKIEGER